MKTYHAINTPPPKQPKKSIDDVPEDLLVEWSLKLFALMNLSWDYIDTICDVCISLRIQETKPLVRQIRTLKREYDHFRYFTMRPDMERNETEHGLRFEEMFIDDFTRLTNGIELEVNKLGLTLNHRMLVVAVQQALTLMDAVKIYARWCDSRIASFGVWVCDCCMVQTEFMKLYDLVPQFAGDCYQPNIEARRLTAGILVNRLKGIDIHKLLNEHEVIKPVMQ